MITSENINKNHKIMCFTNLLLIVSLFYYFLYIENKPFIENILAIFLIITIIFSQLFWNNPIKNSLIHKIDAKIVICSFVLYTLLYKFTFIFLLVVLSVGISFYFSNYYSRQEWCSNNHIFCHGLLHTFCFIATFFTFYPI